eukprot:g3653.t1
MGWLGDVLIHCGDFSKYKRCTKRSVAEFDKWLGRQKSRYKYGIFVVPGNHDVILDTAITSTKDVATLRHATVLHGPQTGIVKAGPLQLYGAPYIPARGCLYRARAFQRTDEARAAQWSAMTKKKGDKVVDVLITHGPPLGVADEEAPGAHVGDPIILNAVQALQPTLHVFGHVHHQRGAFRNTLSKITCMLPAKSAVASASASSPSAAKIFVGGIPYLADVTTLRKHFGAFGEVVDVVIPPDRYTQKPRGFAFVTFRTQEAMKKSLKNSTHTIKGKNVEVKRAVPRNKAPPPTNSRGGGGHHVMMSSPYANGGHHHRGTTIGSAVPQGFPAAGGGGGGGGRRSLHHHHHHNPYADVSTTTEIAVVRKIFIGGLHNTVTENVLRAYFQQYGNIVDAVVMYDRVSKRSRGFGFVTFENERSVVEAMRSQNHEINGKHIEIKKAEPRESRLGVGGGGAASSGSHQRRERTRGGGKRGGNGRGGRGDVRTNGGDTGDQANRLRSSGSTELSAMEDGNVQVVGGSPVSFSSGIDPAAVVQGMDATSAMPFPAHHPYAAYSMGAVSYSMAPTAYDAYGRPYVTSPYGAIPAPQHSHGSAYSPVPYSGPHGPPAAYTGYPGMSPHAYHGMSYHPMVAGMSGAYGGGGGVVPPVTTPAENSSERSGIDAETASSSTYSVDASQESKNASKTNKSEIETDEHAAAAPTGSSKPAQKEHLSNHGAAKGSGGDDDGDHEMKVTVSEFSNLRVSDRSKATDDLRSA